MRRSILALMALAGVAVALSGCETLLRPYKAADRDPNAGGGSSMYKSVDGKTW